MICDLLLYPRRIAIRITTDVLHKYIYVLTGKVQFFREHASYARIVNISIYAP